MNFFNMRRCLSRLAKLQQQTTRLSNTNNIIFNYHLDTHHYNHEKVDADYPKKYERFMDEQLLNTIKRAKDVDVPPQELKSISDFKELTTKARSRLLISFRHHNITNEDIFNDFIRNLFHHKTILMNDTGVRFYIRSMKYTDFCIDLKQLNYIIKNIIKTGRYNEVDEVLEELHLFNGINEQDFSMVKKPTLLNNGFLDRLFQRENNDSMVKVELLDNLIKVYYELNDYRYMKELIRYRERYHRDKIMDTETMFIKVNWRINSNYNHKFITKIIHDFVQFQGIKYEKLDMPMFYKILEQLLTIGDIELISFYLNAYRDQFDTAQDPLVLLMLSRFRSFYLGDNTPNASYYQRKLQYQMYFKDYTLKNDIHQCGRLLHLVNKDMDISLILKDQNCLELIKTKNKHPIGSYFIETLLKINSKKIINQKQVFELLSKENITPSNLDGTAELDLNYYRMLLAYEFKDMEYFKNELSKESSPSMMEHFDLYLKMYREFYPKMAENLLMVLMSNSIVKAEDEVNPKVVAFNKMLTSYKMDQEKYNKLIFSKATPIIDDLIHIQRLHHEDRILTSRHILKKWQYGYESLLGKARQKEVSKFQLPPTETLLSMDSIFRNPFIEESLKKNSLCQAISMNYYLRFLLSDYDECSFNDFLQTKRHFRNIFPVELLTREFHRSVASDELEVVREVDKGVAAAVVKKYEVPTVANYKTMLNTRLKRKWYSESFHQGLNDECLLQFLKALREFEETAKLLVHNTDLLKLPYFKLQLQAFMENSIIAMLHRHRYISASMVLKRYLWGYVYNFMSETSEPLVEWPSRKMLSVVKNVKETFLGLLNVKEEAVVFYDVIYENLKKLSADSEANTEDAKIILSNKLVDDLPYKNKQYTYKDMLATRRFFDELRTKFPKSKLYWILKMFDELKKVNNVLFKKNKKKHEKATQDLLVIYEKLSSHLK